MKRRHRIYFTEAQKSEIWDRWERGESMSSIGRLFERNSSSIFPVLAPTGGIRPAVRKRSRLALSLAEREEISRGLGIGASLRSIARRLKRAPSSISREVTRNGAKPLTELPLQTRLHGTGPAARRVANWLATNGSATQYRRNCNVNGRLNRLPGG